MSFVEWRSSCLEKLWHLPPVPWLRFRGAQKSGPPSTRSSPFSVFHPRPQRATNVFLLLSDFIDEQLGVLRWNFPIMNQHDTRVWSFRAFPSSRTLAASRTLVFCRKQRILAGPLWGVVYLQQGCFRSLQHFRRHAVCFLTQTHGNPEKPTACGLRQRTYFSVAQ